jgi:hypothetical protein
MMSLIVFRSKAAGEFYMLSENAQAVFAAMDIAPAPQGVITATHVPQALAKLQAIIDEAKAPAPEEEESDDPPPAMARPVGFAQRAFPMLEMLRAAAKKNVDVTWNV